MRKLWWLILMAPLLFLPTSSQQSEREKIWRYEKPFPVQFREDYVSRRLDEIEAKIKTAENTGHYPVIIAYQTDRVLRLLAYGSHFPSVYTTYGIIGYGDEAETVPPNIWRIWNLENTSAEMRKRYSGTPSELTEYDRLKTVSAEDRAFWFPELKSYWKTRYLHSLVNTRLWLVLVLVLFSLFCLWKRTGWMVRKIFSKQTFQFFSYFMVFCLSFFTAPALMAQAAGSKKKKEKKQIEEIIHAVAVQSPTAHEPPKNTITLGLFGDFTHDRQEFAKLTRPINAKTDLVLFNQNRQAANGGPKFSLITAGLRLKLGKAFTLAGFAGPQFSLDKSRVDQMAAFFVASASNKNNEISVTNRLSWGIDGKIPFANRHIISIRVVPMPRWLAAGVEIRRSKGGINENFWGPIIKVGQLFRPGRWKQFLGGLYFYPFFDFAKKNWDIRTGITFSFAR